jgi:hypothetical protein
MKRLVLIALLLTAWAVPAASDNPTINLNDIVVPKQNSVNLGDIVVDEPNSVNLSDIVVDEPNSAEKMKPVAAGDAVAWHDLVERNGVYFKKFTDVPFEGRLAPPDTGVFRRGRPEGKFLLTLLKNNNRILSERSYLNGRPHGTWVRYNLDGTLDYRKNYRDGVRHGPYISYRMDGQLSLKGNYKNGKWDGPCETDDDGYGTRLDEDGKIWSGIYRDGKRVACLPITPPELCVIEP